jgi:hypothetical protein
MFRNVTDKLVLDIAAVAGELPCFANGHFMNMFFN